MNKIELITNLVRIHCAYLLLCKDGRYEPNRIQTYFFLIIDIVFVCSWACNDVGSRASYVR